MPAAILLAAGLSTRLGQPKQLLTLQGETLLARAVRIAGEAGLSPILAVISQPALVPLLAQLGAVPLLNPNPAEGLASSIRCGIMHARQLPIEGAVVLTCDQVALTPAHLRALIAQPASVTGSAYSSRIGIPAYFPLAAFDQLLTLTGDTGARDLLRHARSIPCEALAIDIDTEADRIRAGVQFPVKPPGL